MQKLINASKSSRGWSYYSSFFRCPRLWAYEHVANLDFGSSPAQTHGSMVHTALAHFIARKGAIQPGGIIHDGVIVKDPDYFLQPRDAIVAWADLNPTAGPYVDKAIETFESWLTDGNGLLYRFDVPESSVKPGKATVSEGGWDMVLAVEQEVMAVLGNLATPEGLWGLWIGSWKDGKFIHRASDGNEFEIHPTPLDCEGHPEHGQPIHISRRFDAIIRSRNDRLVYVDDHKVVSGDTSANKEISYRFSGEFSLCRIFGRQLYGDSFGGARLHLVASVQVDDNGIPVNAGKRRLSQLHKVTPMHLDHSFANDLYVAAHEIANLQLQGGDAFQWPAARHMDVCNGGFVCKGMELCRMGASGIVAGRPVMMSFPGRKY